jgi:hypothetical protein
MLAGLVFFWDRSSKARRPIETGDFGFPQRRPAAKLFAA